MGEFVTLATQLQEAPTEVILSQHLNALMAYYSPDKVKSAISGFYGTSLLHVSIGNLRAYFGAYYFDITYKALFGPNSLNSVRVKALAETQSNQQQAKAVLAERGF